MKQFENYLAGNFKVNSMVLGNADSFDSLVEQAVIPVENFFHSELKENNVDTLQVREVLKAQSQLYFLSYDFEGKGVVSFVDYLQTKLRYIIKEQIAVQKAVSNL